LRHAFRTDCVFSVAVKAAWRPGSPRFSFDVIFSCTKKNTSNTERKSDEQHTNRLIVYRLYGLQESYTNFNMALPRARGLARRNFPTCRLAPKLARYCLHAVCTVLHIRPDRAIRCWMAIVCSIRLCWRVHVRFFAILPHSPPEIRSQLPKRVCQASLTHRARALSAVCST
jgi:hypothetical protein